MKIKPQSSQSTTDMSRINIDTFCENQNLFRKSNECNLNILQRCCRDLSHLSERELMHIRNLLLNVEGFR